MPSQAPRPDLNIDLGEQSDEAVELYTLAHRVNVACGGHAGDPASMRKACELARGAGALVGAHPSFPDREHFGRSIVAMTVEALKASLEEQCGTLRAIAQRVGIPVGHMKPHGALYHSADRDAAMAAAVIAASRAALGDVVIVGPPRGELSRAARSAGLAFLAEGFADRGYDREDHLIARGSAGSLIEDPAAAAAQALRLEREGRYQTICVHSDTPNAVLIARAVRTALDGS